MGDPGGQAARYLGQSQTRARVRAGEDRRVAALPPRPHRGRLSVVGRARGLQASLLGHLLSWGQAGGQSSVQPKSTFPPVAGNATWRPSPRSAWGKPSSGPGPPPRPLDTPGPADLSHPSSLSWAGSHKVGLASPSDRGLQSGRSVPPPLLPFQGSLPTHLARSPQSRASSFAAGVN